MASSQTVPTLLLGGRVYARSVPGATAMVVTGDAVSWVGRDDEGLARYGATARIVPLRGALVTPAFVDTHVHATSAGLALTGLDLTGARSLGECLDAVRAFVATHRGAVVWGHGWEETNWPEGRPPSRAELDHMAGDELVYLSRIDVHSALVSTALVERSPRVSIAEGWSDAGPLTKDAHHQARRLAQDLLSVAQRKDAQRVFLRHVAGHGIVSVHECAGPAISGPDDLKDLLALSALTGMPDVVGYWGELGAVDTAARLGAYGVGGDLFVDGALGSRTAALCEPYTDDPGNRGTRYLDAAQIAEHLVACTVAGVQGGFHVIGDAAVAEIVTGFELAEEQVGTQALVAGRHRLEHLEMIDAEQAHRLAALGVTASMQPLFDDAWGGTGRAYAARLGLPRGARLNPFATVAGAGMRLAFGSDAPVTPVGPWAAVLAAVHHRTESFGLSSPAAFDAHTAGGWHAARGTDGVTGSLVPGAPASYAIWDTGELPIDAGLPVLERGGTLPRCLHTVLRGQPIYSGDELDA